MISACVIFFSLHISVCYFPSFRYGIILYAHYFTEGYVLVLNRKPINTSDDVTTDADLADTFVSRMINDDNVSDVTNDDFSAKEQTFSRSDLITEQNSDPDVFCSFARSVDESDVSRDPVCFYTKNDVLMRKWRPSDVLADNEFKKIFIHLNSQYTYIFN